MRIDQVDTPALLIDDAVLDRNVDQMQRRVSAAGKQIRPHVKTHKLPYVAHKQIAAGAAGVTVAKLDEAEAFIEAGITDVFVCYPLVGAPKLARLRRLRTKARIAVAVDSHEVARAISEAFARSATPLDVLIKVDMGFGRVGCDPAIASNLYSSICALPGLRVLGLCIHEGSTYLFPDTQARDRESARQCAGLVRLTAEIRDEGFDVSVVSSGSTPGLAGSLTVGGVTEVRPGNYVFNDMNQVALGVSTLDDCALTVATRVVSTDGHRRAILDAGSKAFSLDRGAHGSSTTRGYGGSLSDIGPWSLDRLSEEHGWLTSNGGSSAPRSLGELLRFVPNHACPTVNNFAFAYLVRGDEVIDRLPVEGRGLMT